VTVRDALPTSGSVTSQIPLTMKCDVSNTTWPRSWRLVTGYEEGCIASQGPGEAGSSAMPASLVSGLQPLALQLQPQHCLGRRVEMLLLKLEKLN
jgi:hypothetical protein